MVKKRRLDDYPIFGTKDMIEGYLRILRRDSRRHWDALTIWEIGRASCRERVTIWDIPEDEGTDTDEGH